MDLARSLALFIKIYSVALQNERFRKPKIAQKAHMKIWSSEIHPMIAVFVTIMYNWLTLSREILHIFVHFGAGVKEMLDERVFY